MINLAVVQGSLRIRTEKELLAIINNPQINKIIMILQNDNHLKDVHRWRDERIRYYSFKGREEMKDILVDEEINIVHTHNAPDSIGTFFLNLIRFYELDIKLIHEIHDTLSFTMMIRQEYLNGDKESHLYDENLMCTGADGLVLCSEGQKLYLWGKYGFDYDRAAVLYPFPSQKQVPKMIRRPRHTGNIFTYCGNLGVDWLDYRDLFRKLTDQGHQILVYSTRPGYAEAYKMEGLEFRTDWDYPNMLSKIRYCDGGIIPDFNGKEHQRYTIMSNKLLDYIVAGIPIIYCDRIPILMERIIHKYGIGVHISNITKKGLQEARVRVQEVRSQFFMENHIHKLLELYQRVLE